MYTPKLTQLELSLLFGINKCCEYSCGAKDSNEPRRPIHGDCFRLKQFVLTDDTGSYALLHATRDNKAAHVILPPCEESLELLQIGKIKQGGDEVDGLLSHVATVATPKETSVDEIKASDTTYETSTVLAHRRRAYLDKLPGSKAVRTTCYAGHPGATRRHPLTTSPKRPVANPASSTGHIATHAAAIEIELTAHVPSDTVTATTSSTGHVATSPIELVNMNDDAEWEVVDGAPVDHEYVFVPEYVVMPAVVKEA